MGDSIANTRKNIEKIKKTIESGDNIARSDRIAISSYLKTMENKLEIELKKQEKIIRN